MCEIDSRERRSDYIEILTDYIIQVTQYKNDLMKSEAPKNEEMYSLLNRRRRPGSILHLFSFQFLFVLFQMIIGKSKMNTSFINNRCSLDRRH